MSRFRSFLRHPVLSVRAAVDGVVRSFTPKDPELRRLANGENGEIPGIELSPFTIMQLDAVWSCVRLISETIATLPLGMYERRGVGRAYAPEHPLQFIIHDQPNVDSTAAVFWEAVVAAMLLRGCARVEKLFVGSELVGLQFLTPAKFHVRRDWDTGRERYFYQRENGTLREIARDRLWVIPGFTLDGKTGVSVVQYGARVFGTALAAERAASRTFTNGLLQTIYYKVANFLKPNQRAEFRENVLGSVERGETPLLEGGTDMASVGVNPADAQLLQSRGFSVESICRWFRVPPWMVGHTEKSTSWGTGIEQQMIGFLTFTLAPWLRRLEQAINKDLLRAEDKKRFYAKFAVEGLLRADSAARAAFYSAMVNNGILTRDEVRELEDRAPMGGNAAVLTVQSAMVPLDGLGSGDNAATVQNQLRDSLVALLGFNQDAKD